jgi:hypothetical protein
LEERTASIFRVTELIQMRGEVIQSNKYGGCSGQLEGDEQSPSKHEKSTNIFFDNWRSPTQ